MKNIILFGGTFDPFHNGHMYMIDQVYKNLKCDTFILIPNFLNPQKDTYHFSIENRLLSLQKLTLNLSKIYNDVQFICSEFEIQQNKACFTCDTIAHFKKTNPNDNLFFLIGSDNFFSFHTWKDYQYILNQIMLIIIRRDDFLVDAYQDYVYTNLHQKEFTSMMMIGNQPFQLSSSLIKKNKLSDAVLKSSVPKAIYEVLSKSINKL